MERLAQFNYLFFPTMKKLPAKSFKKQMNNFWQRALTGSLFVVTLVACTVLSEWSFFILLFAINFLCLLEFFELMLPDKELRLALGQPYDGYFATRDKFEAVRDKYEEKVALTLRAAQKISDRVVAFSTPIYLAGEDRIRYDVESLREQIDATYAACESVGGVVAVRFDERFLQDDTLFSNLTHLNLHGNREFGAWMAGELGEGTAGPPAALASQPEVGATRR